MKTKIVISYSEIIALHYCLCQTKKEYYRNLDEKKVSNNKIFWKKVKSFYLKKIVSRE